MKRPRFIAGAVCPACGAMDRLQVVGEGESRRRRCVSCGHEDDLAAVASPSPRSRLDSGGRRSADDAAAVQTVRILPAADHRSAEASDQDGPESTRD